MRKCHRVSCCRDPHSCVIEVVSLICVLDKAVYLLLLSQVMGGATQIFYCNPNVSLCVCGAVRKNCKFIVIGRVILQSLLNFK